MGGCLRTCPRYVDGNRYVLDPHVYKRETIMLKLVYMPNKVYGSNFRIQVNHELIRFENANEFSWTPFQTYLVVFKCERGSRWTGNFIISYSPLQIETSAGKE